MLHRLRPVPQPQNSRGGILSIAAITTVRAQIAGPWVSVFAGERCSMRLVFFLKAARGLPALALRVLIRLL